MIDTASERLLSLREVSASLSTRPHVCTVWRWVQKGVRGIRLQTTVIGGRRFTSAEKLAEFIAATTAAADGSPPPTRTPRQRQRAIERAEAELLARAGI